jgi:hypothetical protein
LANAKLQSKKSDRSAITKKLISIREARLALAEGFEHRPVQPAKNRGRRLLFDPRREHRDS